MRIKEVIAANVKHLRDSKDWSQAKLAEESSLSLFTIQGIESGRHKNREETVLAIAQALGVEEHELFQIPQEEKPVSKDEAYDKIKALLDEKRPSPSHIPAEFLELAKKLPLDDEKRWSRVTDVLKSLIVLHEEEQENNERLEGMPADEYFSSRKDE